MILWKSHSYCYVTNYHKLSDTNLSCYCFHGSRVWAQHSCALGSRSHKAEIKVSIGAQVSSEAWVLFHSHSGCWQNSVPCAGKTKVPIFLLRAIDWRLVSSPRDLLPLPDPGLSPSGPSRPKGEGLNLSLWISQSESLTFSISDLWSHKSLPDWGRPTRTEGQGMSIRGWELWGHLSNHSPKSLSSLLKPNSLGLHLPRTPRTIKNEKIIHFYIPRIKAEMPSFRKERAIKTFF